MSKVKINPNDAQALLARVSGKKPAKSEKPMEEGPVDARGKTDEQLEAEARKKIVAGLQAKGEKDSKETPQMVVGDEEVSDEQDTRREERETEHADYEGETKNSDVLAQLDAEDGREVSESQIEDEERLSELEAKEDIRMPPPPTGHEKPHAGEPEEEAEIIDEEENVLTRIYEKEEPGEITQIYLGEVEEEITQKGFAKAPVKNEDLLMVLKKIDEMIKGVKAENAELKSENKGLKAKLNPENLKVLVAAVVSEEMKKVKIPEPDMERIKEIVEDAIQEKIGDEGFMGILVYNTIKDNPELLDSAVVRTGVGAVPEKKDIPKPIEQVKEEHVRAGADSEKADIAANAMNDTIDALKVAHEEGPDGEQYLDALEACEKKYGEKIVAIVLKGLPKAELEAFMDEDLATLVRMRAEYVIKEYYSG